MECERLIGCKPIDGPAIYMYTLVSVISDCLNGWFISELTD